MSFEQRNEYFCKAQTDMQMIYIEAEREVRQLKAENAKLHKLVDYMTPIALYSASERERDELRKLGIGV